jgi:ABC-2 type transport system ATP-binding protein
MWAEGVVQVKTTTSITATVSVVAALENVTRRFGSISALDNLSLAIRRGETVALLGPNGAGKTTAVDVLVGLRTPHTGEAQLFGGSPDAAVARGQVGVMLQDAGVPKGVTVAELVGAIAGLYPDPLSVEDALAVADLVDVAGRQVQRLSGGQRQRVRLALALAANPELLVLDEPTAALDVEARRAFWDRARAYVSGGRALLFATHRLEEADAVADRVAVIARGRLVAEGSPDEIRTRAAGQSTVSFVADGFTPEAVDHLPGVVKVEPGRGRLTISTTDPDGTVRALLRGAPEVAGLEVRRAGLEEAFLSLTHEGGS